MKKLIVIVAVVLMFGGSISANGIIPSSGSGGGGSVACPPEVPPGPPGVDIEIDNKAISNAKSSSTSISCSEAMSGSNSSLVQDIDYEERLQGASPQLPSHLWMVPRDRFYWNQLGFDPALLEGVNWTEQTAKNMVDSPKIPFVRGKMKVVVHNLMGKKYKASESLKFSLTPPSDDYVFNGSVNVAAKNNQKDLTVLICIARAVENALKQGADLVVLTHGLNTVNQGSSFGIGTTLISSSGNNAATGAGGIGLADTKQRGEPAAILVMYKSKAAMQAAAAVAQARVSENPKKTSPIDGLFKAVGNLFSKK